MAHTYHQHFYHLIWSNKEREPIILNSFKEQLYSFINGSFQKVDCFLYKAGGISDHIHMLVGIPPKHAISEIVRDIKLCSGKWVNANFPTTIKFSWQEGFGSFTVSTSNKESVERYTINQEEHHKTRSFKEEFLMFLDLHEISYDEKFLWK